MTEKVTEFDWKSEADYEYLEVLEPAGWAFEFLRRNPEYQADYETITAIEAALTKQYGPCEDNREAWRQDGKSWICVPPIKDGQSLKQWQVTASLSSSHPSRTWYLDWYKARWGLTNQFPDPSCPAVPAPKFNALDEFPLFPKYAEVGEFFLGDDCDGNQMRGTAVVVFDLWRPIKEQIKIAGVQLVTRAKEHMAEEKMAYGTDTKPQLKAHKPGNAILKYRQYLRTLDAAASGAEPKEIAAVIYGLEDNTSASGYNASKRGTEKVRAAQAVAKFRYLMIPFMNLTSE